MPKKFYVVWAGRETGVFTDWAYTKRQVDQFPAAKYKSFTTQAEAEAAFAAGHKSVGKSQPDASRKTAIKSADIKQTITESASAKRFDVIIYCDGGSNPNPGKAASGVAVYRKGKLMELWYGLYNPQGTNNSAELNALYQALLIAQKEIIKGNSVQVLCDSQYSIKCVIEWAFSWKKKGWKRKTAGDIKNLDIIQQAHALFVSISNDIDVSYVKAHIGIEGNELADRMTIYGIAQQESDFCRYSEPLDIRKILAFKAG